MFQHREKEEKQIQKDAAWFGQLLEEESAGLQTPVELSPSAVTARLKAGQGGPKRRSRHPFGRRLAAFAIAAAVGLGCWGAVLLASARQPKPVTYVPAKPAAAANDYTALYDALDNLKKRQATQEMVTIVEDTVKGIFNGGATDKFSGNAAPEAGPSTDGTGNFSSTNVQVQGVDEGDLVKTDGQYLYLITDQAVLPYTASGAEKEFLRIHIVKCDGENMNITSTIATPPDMVPRALYLQGNSLVLLASSDYSSRYQSDGARQKTMAVIYDVTDKSAPKEVRRVEQDGSYLSSRMAGSRLTVVSNHLLSNLSDTPRKEYKNLIPETLDTLGSGMCEKVPSGCIDILQNSMEKNYLVVSSLDIASADAPSTRAVLGAGETIYATQDTLTVACAQYESGRGKTNLLRFSLSGEVKQTGMATVDGTLLNQFAMHELDGYFAVATTASGKSGETVNNLTILDKDLNPAGKVEGLAPGESIQSVRFLGNMAYLVTFRQVDPLFAIDLSNPRSPKVLGQLKIPGFSSYLHPYDQNTLIGIGTGGDWSGATGGVKVALYDVSDPAHLKETASYTMGLAGSFSLASQDHHAVTFDKSRSLLYIPVALTQSDGNGFEGLAVFRIAPGSIEEVGRVTCSLPQDGTDLYYTHSFLNVRRSVVMGDSLYVISSANLVSVDLKDFTPGQTLWLYDLSSSVKQGISPSWERFRYDGNCISPPPTAELPFSGFDGYTK